ncbi:MAG: hypothetical protein NVS4B12_08840 [Ktedonobacteraceae bacterium]
MGRRLGLVVGVNHYQDNTFQPLQFAENDARAFAQWLVNDKGGKWAPADVQYVNGMNAKRDLVESLALQLCLSVAQPDDLVLIYIASHAFLDENNGDGYLALADTAYGNASTGLHLLSLAQQTMTRSRAAQIVFMLDSFQTGREWSIRRTSPYDVQPLLAPALLHGIQQQQNRILLCSCRGNEFSPERGERGLGMLLYRMIVGLSGAAADATTGNVTLQTLYTYLSNTLGNQQRPQVFGQAPTPIVLVGNMPLQQQVAHTVPASHAQPVAAYAAPAQSSVSPQASYNTTATAQLSLLEHQQQRSTSGTLRSKEIEQHSRQQSSLLLDQALQQFQMQNVEQALRLTDQALYLTPGESSGLTLKGQILGTMGRFPEALAIVEQLCQKEPNNALAWSMDAVLLTNMGRPQEALSAIEHSLELDASNPESYAIKTNIMPSIAIAQNKDKTLPKKNELIASEKRRGGPQTFFVSAGLQLVGLLLGIAGGLLPIFRSTLPIWLPFLLESFGLALLVVIAARGSYRHGLLRVLVTFLFSLIPAAILGISLGYHPAYRKIFFELQAHTALLLPLLFLGLWLAVAAVVPFVLAIIGFVSGMVTGVRRRR